MGLSYIRKRLWQLAIWVSSQKIKQVTQAGLNRLWQRRYQISVKNWIFDDPFHQKGPVLVILVPGVIKPSVPGKFFEKIGL